ncbi:MAG: NifB/NifX family molybdenum-iron cluster-binding protein [Flavobacteriaceae bacterium]|nr:NifB/NifX family molybdenum-iron cluster-binding protein [Flavobacteriaceae bacterium]
MKKLFAVPTINKKLCAHFGHSEQFAVVETEGQKIINVTFFTPPVHQPGTYPRFLADKGVSTIISGGMGQKAQDIFTHHNIEVFMGIDEDSPEALVKKYLEDQLESGDNQCDQ